MRANRSLVACSTLALAAAAGLLIAGPLSPPSGPVASTFKTLGEVEPRIAINATNTPGDADSFYVITSPGSYYLTGNVSPAGRNGIKVLADDVTIDLGGFRLAATSARAVSVHATVTGFTLRNGNIDGFVTAIFAPTADGATIERVSVTDTAGTALWVGHQSHVTDCTISSCGGSGIAAGAFSVIRGCSLRNVGSGISVGRTSIVADCAVAGSNEDGFIATDSGVTFTNCVATECLDVGFEADTGAIFDRCTARASFRGFDIGDASMLTNSLAIQNIGQGMRIGSSCTVTSNACRNNGTASDSAGMWVVGWGNHIESNDFSGNDWGLWVDGSDNVIIRNSARANPLGAFSVPAAGNDMAPVVASPGTTNFTTSTYFSNFSH